VKTFLRLSVSFGLEPTLPLDTCTPNPRLFKKAKTCVRAVITSGVVCSRVRTLHSDEMKINEIKKIYSRDIHFAFWRRG
jgi:hypothetical protein